MAMPNTLDFAPALLAEIPGVKEHVERGGEIQPNSNGLQP